MLTNAQMQTMIDSAAKAYTYGVSNPAPAGTTFIQSINDPKTGAHAQIYKVDGTGEYIVAFTGTQPDIGGQDLYADFGHNGLNQWDALKPKLDEFLRSTTATTIHFTGESLGGALAQYATYDMAQTLQRKGTQVTMTTLNALGGQAGIVERYGSVDAAKLEGVDATHLFAVSQGGLPDGVSRLGEGHLGGQTYRVDLNQELGFVDRHIALRDIASTFDWNMAAVDTPSYIHISLGTEITQFVGNLAYTGGVNDVSGYLRAAGGLLTAMATIPKAERDQFIDMLSPNDADAKRIGDYIFDHPLTKGGSILSGVALSLLGVLTESIPQILEKFDGYAYFGWSPQLLVTSTFFTAAQRFVPRRDPLTLDLNGNGLETVPINAANPIYFDLTGEGVQASVGWVAPNDGFLVLDRNGDGLINDGTELFGDATPAYEAGTTVPSTDQTADGFAALAQEDTNADGVVNSADANFANLRVWQDANQDGVSQAGELKTLAELGIASFNVASINHSQLLSNGNQIADTGTYTKTDGSTGTAGVTAGMADINLAVDTFHRTFADVIPVTPQTETLPDMQGSGMVRDLRQAASIQTTEGATLATALGQFAAATTRNEQRAQLDALLSDWAGTAGFEDMAAQAAAHGYTFSTNLTPAWQQKLLVLETFNGRSFYSMPWDNTNAQSGVTGMSVTGSHISIFMNGTQLALLDQAYSALRESVYDALVVQTRLKPYLDDISLTLTGTTGTGIALDFTALDTRLGTAHTGNANTAIGDLLDLRRLMGDTLEASGWDGLAQLTDWAATDAGDAAAAATLADFGYNGGIHTNATGTVDGGNANDIVAGQTGDDALSGGSGNDWMIEMNVAASANDTYWRIAA